VRYLILSDIHANWEAMQGVLNHVRRKSYDQIVFLGDAVGYGASPNQVLSWLRSVAPDPLIVRGNHDRVCAGLDSAEYFNRFAREASMWTLDQLDGRNLEFLRSFPVGPLDLSDQVAICHGSVIDEDSYLFSVYDARVAFDALTHPVVFFGHTHVPSLFKLGPGELGHDLEVQVLRGRRVVVDFEPGCRYLVNPGSVGQPRDRDPRAAYAIYDEEQHRLHLYRVNYRVAMARRRIMQAGLPVVLGDRLLYGA
jgi:predicted phosphodiesterase